MDSGIRPLEQMINRLLIVISVLLAFLATPSAAEDTFPIGFTLPLSGPFAEFGVAAQNALQLAQEDSPSLMNRTRFILEDDQYNAKNSLSAFQKLRTVDGAKLILVWGNEPALAVAPVAESTQFPLIAFGQTPSIAAGRRHVLRVLGPADEFGKPIAHYLNDQKSPSIQMILLDNTFYQLVAESLRAALATSATYNVLATVPASETDFRPYLMRVKNTPEKFIGVFLTPAQLIPFFKQAHELRITNPIFGSTSFESKSVVSEARQLMHGAVYAHVKVDPTWHDRYLKRFGNDIQVSYAAVAYDTVVAIATCIAEQEDGASGHSILESMASLPLRRGASGEFFATSSIAHGRFVNFEVILKRVLNEAAGPHAREKVAG